MTFNMYKNVYKNNVVTKKRIQVALTKEVFLDVIMEQQGTLLLYMHPYK